MPKNNWCKSLPGAQLGVQYGIKYVLKTVISQFISRWTTRCDLVFEKVVLNCLVLQGFHFCLHEAVKANWSMHFLNYHIQLFPPLHMVRCKHIHVLGMHYIIWIDFTIYGEVVKSLNVVYKNYVCFLFILSIHFICIYSFLGVSFCVNS